MGEEEYDKSVLVIRKIKIKTKPTIPTLSKPNGTKATSSKDKAETLNDFFSSVFTLEFLHDIPTVPTYLVEEVISTIDITLSVKSYDPWIQTDHQDTITYILMV